MCYGAAVLGSWRSIALDTPLVVGPRTRSLISTLEVFGFAGSGVSLSACPADDCVSGVNVPWELHVCHGLGRCRNKLKPKRSLGASSASMKGYIKHLPHCLPILETSHN